MDPVDGDLWAFPTWWDTLMHQCYMQYDKCVGEMAVYKVYIQHIYCIWYDVKDILNGVKGTITACSQYHHAHAVWHYKMVTWTYFLYHHNICVLKCNKWKYYLPIKFPAKFKDWRLSKLCRPSRMNKNITVMIT